MAFWLPSADSNPDAIGINRVYTVPIFNSKKERAPTLQANTLPYFGSPARTRTTDKLVNSQLLYQLSYWGISIFSKSKRVSIRTYNLLQLICEKSYLQSTQVASSLKGTPVVLLIYLSWSSGAKNLPHTGQGTILKTLSQMILLAPSPSYSIFT